MTAQDATDILAERAFDVLSALTRAVLTGRPRTG
jgi:hypothetical protein